MPGERAFAQEFAEALAVGGVSMSALRDRLSRRGLSISLATLSYWRTGARHPEGAASAAIVTGIEVELGLESGALTRFLAGRSRRRGRVSAPASLRDSEGAETFALLAVSPPDSLRILSLRETIEISASGTVSEASSVLLVQCVQDRVDSLGVLLTASRPTEIVPVLRNLAGCTLARTVRHPGGTMSGFALALDRSLEPGETAMVSFEAVSPEGYPAPREHLMTVRRPVREIVQWFRAAGDRAPEWFDETEMTSRGTRTVTVAAGTTRSVHRLRRDFGPGGLRMRWGFDDD